MVHVCSIANSGYRDNFKPVHFLFYEKIFIVKKHKKSTRNPKKAKKKNAKQETFILLVSFICAKYVAFVVFCSLIFVLLVDVCL